MHNIYIYTHTHIHTHIHTHVSIASPGVASLLGELPAELGRHAARLLEVRLVAHQDARDTGRPRVRPHLPQHSTPSLVVHAHALARTHARMHVYTYTYACTCMSLQCAMTERATRANLPQRSTAAAYPHRHARSLCAGGRRANVCRASKCSAAENRAVGDSERRKEWTGRGRDASGHADGASFAGDLGSEEGDSSALCFTSVRAGGMRVVGVVCARVCARAERCLGQPMDHMVERRALQQWIDIATMDS